MHLSSENRCRQLDPNGIHNFIIMSFCRKKLFPLPNNREINMVKIHPKMSSYVGAVPLKMNNFHAVSTATNECS